MFQEVLNSGKLQDLLGIIFAMCLTNKIHFWSPWWAQKKEIISLLLLVLWIFSVSVIRGNLKATVLHRSIMNFALPPLIVLTNNSNIIMLFPHMYIYKLNVLSRWHSLEDLIYEPINLVLWQNLSSLLLGNVEQRRQNSNLFKVKEFHLKRNTLNNEYILYMV